MNRLATAIFILCATLAGAGCHKTSESAPEGVAAPTQPTRAVFRVRTVTVTRPQRRTVTQSIALPGDLVGFYEAALHSKVTGYLVKINVDKGDWVKKGQVLAEIEVPELHQNLARAQANMDIARITWQRLNRVWHSDPKLVARETVDIANAKYLEMKASYGELATMVGYTKIIAPFDGVITGRFADPGALIRAGGSDLGISGTGVEVSSGALEGAGGHLAGGGPILSEARLDPLRIYVYVPEREAARVKIGMPATITLRALPGQTLNAQVTRFASSLDLATRTMLTEIDIRNPNHKLYPRMYANVNLTLIKHPNAIEVPRFAISGLGKSSAYLFTVSNGKLRKTSITTGLTDGTNVEITSGLSDSDTVVAHMSPSLAAGEPVRILAEATQDSSASGHGD